MLVVDRFGNSVSGVTIGLGIAPGALGGTAAGVSNAQGDVVYSNLSESAAGTYTLTAQATNVGTAVSSPFIVSAGTVTRLAFVSQPLSTTADQLLNAVTVEAFDKYNNPVQGALVGITAVGSFHGTTPIASNSLGESVFSDLQETLDGSYVLTASDGTVKATSNAFTIASGAAASLTFVSQPNTVAAGILLNAITVKAADAFNNVVVSGKVTMSIANGTLYGTVTVPLASTGMAVFSTLSVPAATTGALPTLIASDGSALGTSNPFAVTGSTDVVSFSTPPSGGPVATTLGPTVVTLTDQGGFALSGVSISINTTSGTLLTGTKTGVTNASGQETFSTLSMTAAGTYTLTATPVTTSGIKSAVSTPFTITAGNATKLTFVNQPAATSVGAALAPITVKAVDSYGNPVVGQFVTISLPATAAATLSGTTSAATSATGLAMFSGLAASAAGTFSLTASLAGLSVASTSFTVKPAAAVSIYFMTEPNSTTAGSSLGLVTIKAVDAFGDGVPSTSVSLHISLGTVNGVTTLTTNASGLAVFSNLSVNQVGSYTLTAAASGLASAVSNTFTIAAGTAKLSFVTQPIGTSRRQHAQPGDGQAGRQL